MENAGILIGAVASGASALLTLIIANYFSSRGEDRRYTKEAAVRKTERELSYRRDVYFSAVESMHKMIIFTAEFTGIKDDEEVARRNAEYTASLQKVYLVSSIKTTEVITNSANIYAKIICELSFHRLKKKIVESKLENARKKFSETSQFMEGIRQQIDNVRGVPGNAEEFHRLVELHRVNLDEMGIIVNDTDGLSKEFTDLQWHIIERVNVMSGHLTGLLNELILFIRMEMDMAIEFTQFRKLMEKSASDMKVAVSELNESVKTLVAEMSERKY